MVTTRSMSKKKIAVAENADTKKQHIYRKKKTYLRPEEDPNDPNRVKLMWYPSSRLELSACNCFIESVVLVEYRKEHPNQGLPLDNVIAAQNKWSTMSDEEQFPYFKKVKEKIAAAKEDARKVRRGEIY